MAILAINLTQHQLTKEQKESARWVELSDEQVTEIRDLLTFNDLPYDLDMVSRAERLAEIVLQSGARYAMIGGAPFFMSTLERVLKERGIFPKYAFSERIVVEETTEAGETRKTAVFRHKGWVYA